MKPDEDLRFLLPKSAFTRREALGLGGLALLLAACGGTSSSGEGEATATQASTPTTTAGGTTAGGTSVAATTEAAAQPLEDELIVYDWAGYEDPASIDAFKAAYPGTTVTMSFYGDNSELIAKLNAGGKYDVIVPSQNAVAQLAETGGLMPLDKSLVPNYRYYDQGWTDLEYDPGGQYSVVHSYGVTGYLYRNDIVTERPTTLLDFYELLPKYVSEGATSVLEGAENAIPLALMALGFDANSKDPTELEQAKELLIEARPSITKITAQNLIPDAASGKVVLQQTYNGAALVAIAEAKKQGDDFLSWVLPDGVSQRWADNWAIPAGAPHPVAAHAWINYFLDPNVVAQTMTFSGYPTPVPDAFALLAPDLTDSPIFNVDQTTVANYQFVLNPDPQTVNERQRIYNEFRAAG